VASAHPPPPRLANFSSRKKPQKAQIKNKKDKLMPVLFCSVAVALFGDQKLFQ
jgi:hypothetical protein